jgi:hypothetical protein
MTRQAFHYQTLHFEHQCAALCIDGTHKNTHKKKKKPSVLTLSSSFTAFNCHSANSNCWISFCTPYVQQSTRQQLLFSTPYVQQQATQLLTLILLSYLPVQITDGKGQELMDTHIWTFQDFKLTYLTLTVKKFLTM